MAKNQTNPQEHLPKSPHSFSLNPLSHFCHYKPISVNFAPLPKSNNQEEQIIPSFNQDKKYFTPAFALSVDQEYYKHNLQFQCQKFLERVIKVEQKKTNEFQAQQAINPSSWYCQVCRTNYQKYEQHIQSDFHQQKSKKSKANEYIRQLCSIFRKKNRKQACIKSKKIGKDATVMRGQIRKSERIRNKKLLSEWSKVGGFVTKSFNNNSTYILSLDLPKHYETRNYH